MLWPHKKHSCDSWKTSLNSAAKIAIIIVKPASSPIRTVLFIGIGSLLFYVVFFAWMQQRRFHKGPWEVSFLERDGHPTLLVNHPKLQITNVVIQFPGAPAVTNLPQTVRFQHGQVAPMDLPFGRCVFLDTLFLPGTAACEIFGHQIQFMPRTLTIDHVERPWMSGEKILLTNGPSRTLPAN